jgi:hypothetical protein
MERTLLVQKYAKKSNVGRTAPRITANQVTAQNELSKRTKWN